MNPKEGIWTWVCGMVLLTDGPGDQDKAYEFIDANVYTHRSSLLHYRLKSVDNDGAFAGAEDLESNDDGSVDVITPWEDFSAVKSSLEDAGLVAEGGEVTMIASTTVPVDAAGAEKIMGLVDALEDLDDVQNVYTNVDIPDEVLAAL